MALMPKSKLHKPKAMKLTPPPMQSQPPPSKGMGHSKAPLTPLATDRGPFKIKG